MTNVENNFHFKLISDVDTKTLRSKKLSKFDGEKGEI